MAGLPEKEKTESATPCQGPVAPPSPDHHALMDGTLLICTYSLLYPTGTGIPAPNKPGELIGNHFRTVPFHG